MERANDRSLQEAPHTLDGVGVNVATDILADRVVDCLVERIFVTDAPVWSPIVRVNSLGVVGYVRISEGMERLAGPVWDHLKNNLASALDGPNNDGLVALVPMPVASDFTADKGFVDLHNALELDRRSVGNSGADAVAKIPGGFVGDIERPVQLAGGDSLFGFNHQVDGHEPFVER